MFIGGLQPYVLILVVVLCVTNSNSTVSQVGEIDIPHCQDPQLRVAVFKLPTLSTNVRTHYRGMQTERKIYLTQAFQRYDQTYTCLFTEQGKSTPVENRIYLTQVELITSAHGMALESVQMPGYFDSTDEDDGIVWRSNVMQRDYENNGDVFRIVEGNEMVGVIFFRKRSLRIPRAKGCRFTVRWLNGDQLVNTEDAVFARTSENGVAHANYVEENFLIRGERATSSTMAHTMTEARTLPRSRPAPAKVPHESFSSATLPRNQAALHAMSDRMGNSPILPHCRRATPEIGPHDSKAPKTLPSCSRAAPEFVPRDSGAPETRPRNRSTLDDVSHCPDD